MKKITFLIAFFLSMGIVKAQNTCTTALTIQAGSHVVAAVDGSQAPTPICAENGAIVDTTPAGEWYSYTPTINYTVTITTDLAVNANKDTRFHVYTGTCTNLVCYEGDDDGGFVNGDYLSVKTFVVTGGTTYRIAFDNKWSAAGFTFQLIEAPYVEPTPSLVDFTPQTVTLAGSYDICVVDMNGDYLDDIVSVDNNQLHMLYQTATAGVFTPVTIAMPASTYMPDWSMAAGDFDNNGFNDLLYGSGSGVTFMKANSTGTAYTKISGTQYVFSQRSNFIDINNDGDLDAFVCHDVAPNVYYLNNGSGNLIFHQGGMGDYSTGGNYGSIWVDYDNDGDQDLFIAKCRGDNTDAKVDELHKNNGNGTFTNVSVAAGMNEVSQSWSSAWGDFDNDGDMDALIGASANSNGGHKLRKNNGNGTFTDVTTGSGWDTFSGMDHEHVAHDFNNDGWIDVFGANTTIMINNGDFTFTPTSIGATNGPIADLNNDGFLDIYNPNMNKIYFNDGNDYNWIKIQLNGVQSNKNGIGARVEIYGAFGKQIRDVRSGDGFKYMSSLNVHFGIGEATAITKIIIRWPSGVVDTILNPTINQSVLVTENSTLGVDTASNTLFTIYPNPATAVLNIVFDAETTPLTQAQVIDLTGKVVLKRTLDHNSIDVHSLSTGTYILSLKGADGKIHTQKFIKK